MGGSDGLNVGVDFGLYGWYLELNVKDGDGEVLVFFIEKFGKLYCRCQMSRRSC